MVHRFHATWSPGGAISRLIPLLALGALVTACHDAERSFAPRVNGTRFNLSPTEAVNGKIAFHSTRDGDFQIYVMNPDGSGVARVTNDTGGSVDPIWSPDGKRIAYANFHSGRSEIFAINVVGTGETQLTTGGGFPGAWSPDGTRIAFANNSDGDDEIFTMNPDGSGVTRLTDNSFTDRPTGWSPNGAQILFQSDREDGDEELYVMNADGSGVTRLTHSPGRDEGDRAGWSPDGARIVFSSDRDGGLLHVFVMNADGSGVTQLTSGDFVDDDPVWSPDGKHIAFHSTRDGGDEDIFVMNADGTGVTQLTFNDGIFDAVPVWTGGTITSPATQFHFVSNGDFGNLSWFEVDPAGGFTFGSLSVSRGGPTTDPQTSLSYFVFQCDPFFSCNPVRDGFGLIPNGDLGGGGNSLKLRTNTTGNPNFVTFAGPTGPVSVDWRANGLFTQSSSGTSVLSFPGFTHRSQGNFTSASANATGSIVGVPISLTGSGDIGTNHQTTIDIT